MLAWAPSLEAQGRGGFGMMGGRPQLKSGLLTMEEVQEELELTDEQIEEVVGPATELNDSFRSEMRAMFQEGGADPEEIEELLKELREEEKPLIEKLEESQRERLNQLYYQRIGTQIYRDEEAAAALELTDEQKTSIEEILDGAREKMMSAMQELRDGGGDREGARETFQKIGEETEKSLADVLTEEQRKKVEEMKGEAFEFPQRQGREGGRRSDF
jgi:Spy/CpxP family protein refolding chaperone